MYRYKASQRRHVPNAQSEGLHGDNVQKMLQDKIGVALLLGCNQSTVVSFAGSNITKRLAIPRISDSDGVYPRLQ